MRGVPPPPGNPSPPSLREPIVRTVAIVLALTAGVTAKATKAGATWFGVRGPECPIGACFGPLACPGCGLLRSTAAALQGDFALSFATHPTGIAIATLLVGAAVLHFDILRRRVELPSHRLWRRRGHRWFVVTLLLGWLLRVTY